MSFEARQVIYQFYLENPAALGFFLGQYTVKASLCDQHMARMISDEQIQTNLYKEKAVELLNNVAQKLFKDSKKIELATAFFTHKLGEQPNSCAPEKMKRFIVKILNKLVKSAESKALASGLKEDLRHYL